MDIVIDSTLNGKTVREVLRGVLGCSSSIIKKLKFSAGGILVDGAFVTVRHELREGEVLSLALEDKAEDVSPYTVPVELPLGILYEDSSVTVVDKPCGMPSHPSLGHQLDTVSNALAYRYRDKNYVFRPVNRLDRDTSGCMLTANSKIASYKMYRAMTEGKISKRYIAVVDGFLPSENGQLHSYLKRSEGSIVERCETDPDDPEGKEALTDYSVLYTDGVHSVLLLSPVTGRTHQLRVQLSARGCPITGDDMYGNASNLISRQALHSYLTILPHPESGEELKVISPLHDDMKKLICALFGESEATLIFEALSHL